MTFEEFKYKALHPKECDAPGVYKVRLYNYNPDTNYPIIELEDVFEFYFPDFEEAKQNIRSFSYGKNSKPYCGFISFHKYGENASLTYYNKLWLFNTNGNLLDESLSPGTVECHFVPFRGRPDNLIRFHIGDIVEVIDLYNETATLAIIARQPLTIEQAWKINLVACKKKQDEGIDCQPGEDEIATLMTEDDYYKVIFLSEELNDNFSNHVLPTLIMNPHKEVPNEIREALSRKLESLKK